MSNESQTSLAARERLSLMADGEADDSVVAAACAAWRDDARTRSSWHAYQVIGDALRSEDLAGNASRDAAFLAAFRVRLADEPVVLAPDVTPEGEVVTVAARRRSWRTSGAIAAGFVVVAGSVLVMRGPVPNASAPGLVAIGDPSPTVNLRPATLVGPDSGNARLGRYLSAHKQFAGSSALGVSPYLRDASVEVEGR